MSIGGYDKRNIFVNQFGITVRLVISLYLNVRTIRKFKIFYWCLSQQINKNSWE